MISSNSQPDPEFAHIVQGVPLTTRGFAAMQNCPDYHDWCSELLRFGQRDDLRSLEWALIVVASSGSRSDPGSPEYAQRRVSARGRTIDLVEMLNRHTVTLA